MYRVTLTTPRGVLEFNIQALQELEQILLKNPDYTGINATQEKPKVKEMKYASANKNLQKENIR